MITGGVFGGVGSVLALIPGVGPVLLVAGAGMGGYGTGEAIVEGNWKLATFRAVTTLGAFSFTRVAGNNKIPLGFAEEGAFLKFGAKLSTGLKRAGYDDANAYMQGSSVTGKSFKTGSPFDEGRVSDFDIAITGDTLMAKAQQLGIPLRGEGTRTGPLTPRQLEMLGLSSLQAELGGLAGGRPVNFMIYRENAVAISRAESIVIH